MRIGGEQPVFSVPRFSGLTRYAEKHLLRVDTFDRLQRAYPDKKVGHLTKEFLATGMEPKEIYNRLDQLAKVLRELNLEKMPVIEGHLGKTPFSLHKAGEGALGQMFRLHLGGRDFAFKVYDAHREDFGIAYIVGHGPEYETATGLYFTKNGYTKDAGRFYFGDIESRWGMNEWISSDMSSENRSGRSYRELFHKDLGEKRLNDNDPYTAGINENEIAGIRVDRGGINRSRYFLPPCQCEEPELPPLNPKIEVQHTSAVTVTLEKLREIFALPQAERKAALHEWFKCPNSRHRPFLEMEQITDSKLRKEIFDVLAEDPFFKNSLPVDNNLFFKKIPLEERLYYFNKMLAIPEARPGLAKLIPLLPQEIQKETYLKLLRDYPETRSQIADSLVSFESQELVDATWEYPETRERLIKNIDNFALSYRSAKSKELAVKLFIRGLDEPEFRRIAFYAIEKFEGAQWYQAVQEILKRPEARSQAILYFRRRQVASDKMFRLRKQVEAIEERPFWKMHFRDFSALPGILAEKAPQLGLHIKN